MKKWFEITNEAASDEAEVLIFDRIGKSIYGDEGGIEANAFTAAFNAIPKGRKISLKVKSRGGNVWEGMAIHDAIKSRQADVTCTVTGVAASIAAIICCAASKVRMPKNAMMMTHPSQSYAEGDAATMAACADKLRAHDKAIASVIAEKTGKTQAQAEKFLSKETWMSGDDALKEGLCDEVTAPESAVANEVKGFDFSQFRCVPENLRAVVTNNAVAEPKAGADKNTSMDKTKIVALLKQHGIEVSNEVTDEQLLASLGKLGEKPAPAAPVDVVNIENELKAITAQLDAARRQNVTAEVDRLVGEFRIPASQRETAVENAVRDSKHLEFLRALESRPPGAEPFNVVTKIEAGASVADIAKAVTIFDAPMNAIVRGNNVAMREVTNAAFKRAEFIEKHRGQLNAVFNAAGDNTIATELKRNVILQTVVKDFARRVLALNQFSTVFSNVPLEGTNKVEVPYYDLDASTSQVFAAATGYATIGETTTDKREITVGTGATDGGRWYQGMSFTSEEIARQPWLKVMELAQLKADKLAYDIVQDVLSVITAANYGAAAITSGADAFDSDDLADMVTACKKWPEQGRSLFVDTAYHVALLKDASFKHALNAASDLAIKEGRLFPRVFGFDYVENPNLPGNSENLVGFAAHKSAILCAFAPVPPIEEVRNAGTTYRIYVDPTTGVALEYRTYGSNVLDTAYHIIESSFGWAKGNYYQSASKEGALKRIVSA